MTDNVLGEEIISKDFPAILKNSLLKICASVIKAWGGYCCCFLNALVC